MGRSASGVKCIRFKEETDYVASASVISNKENKQVLTVTSEGFGKRTDLEEYSIQKRGGKGNRNFKLAPKTGDVVSSILVDETVKEIMLITKEGVLIRTPIKQISKISRATSGVRIMKPKKGDIVISVALVPEGDENND